MDELRKAKRRRKIRECDGFFDPVKGLKPEGAWNASNRDKIEQRLCLEMLESGKELSYEEWERRVAEATGVQFSVRDEDET